MFHTGSLFHKVPSSTVKDYRGLVGTCHVTVLLHKFLLIESDVLVPQHVPIAVVPLVPFVPNVPSVPPDLCFILAKLLHRKL